MDNAPREVIKTSASDDAITVAGPVLTQSSVLDEEFLVDSARTRSQEHLVAISSRKVVGQRVTDVLLDRGNDQVVLALAQNNGAELSRARLFDDGGARQGQLAASAGGLVPAGYPAAASGGAVRASLLEAVRRQFETESDRKIDAIAAAVRLARQQLEEASQEQSGAYAEARQHIATLKETGGLSEAHILSFARQGQFEEVVVAVAELGELPAIDTERMILDESHERLFVVAKAIGLSWTCVRQILLLNQTVQRPSEYLEHSAGQISGHPPRGRVEGPAVSPAPRTGALRAQALRGTGPSLTGDLLSEGPACETLLQRRPARTAPAPSRDQAARRLALHHHRCGAPEAGPVKATVLMMSLRGGENLSNSARASSRETPISEAAISACSSMLSDNP